MRSYHLVVFLRKITYEQTTESFGASLRFSPADPRTRFIRDFFLFVFYFELQSKRSRIKIQIFPERTAAYMSIIIGFIMSLVLVIFMILGHFSITPEIINLFSKSAHTVQS